MHQTFKQMHLTTESSSESRHRIVTRCLGHFMTIEINLSAGSKWLVSLLLKNVLPFLYSGIFSLFYQVLQIWPYLCNVCILHSADCGEELSLKYKHTHDCKSVLSSFLIGNSNIDISWSFQTFLTSPERHYKAGVIVTNFN